MRQCGDTALNGCKISAVEDDWGPRAAQAWSDLAALQHQLAVLRDNKSVGGEGDESKHYLSTLALHASEWFFQTRADTILKFEPAWHCFCLSYRRRSNKIEFK